MSINQNRSCLRGSEREGGGGCGGEARESVAGKRKTETNKKRVDVGVVGHHGMVPYL